MLSRSFQRITGALALVVAVHACGGSDGATNPDGSDNPGSGPGGAKPVASVVLNPTIGDIPINKPTSITATLRASDGEELTGRTCTWSVTDASIISVTSSGGQAATMTGLKGGTTFVTVSCEHVSATATITVKAITAASIVISPNPATVEVGKTVQLSAVVKDADGNTIARPVTWTSSSSNATVDRTTGLVTGVSAGTAEITASADNATAKVTVTVGLPPIARIEVKPATAQMYPTDAADFEAIAYAADGSVLTRGPFVWTVSDPSRFTDIGVVSGSNRQFFRVYAKTPGSATITATVEGKTGTASVTILTPTTLTLSTNGSGNGTLTADPLAATYRHTTVVTVTPQADIYSYFAGWGGSCSGTTIPCRVTMSVDRTVSATFNNQPWVGLWGGSITAVRTFSDGVSCTWVVTFSSKSYVQITFPRTNGVRTAHVKVLTRITSPAGTASGPGRNCTPTDAVLSAELVGSLGTDGSFTAKGELGPLLVTVTGSMDASRSLPTTLSIVYNPPSDIGSGSTTASTTALPSLDTPVTP